MEDNNNNNIINLQNTVIIEYPEENWIIELIKNYYKDFKDIILSIYCNEDNLIIRKDIQILRAISVILVLFFHLNINKWVFGSGFIGVDIFFVISGYLVVGALIKEERESKFSIINFYSRRIKRLFIPSVLCLSFILICSFIFKINYRVYKDLFAASLHYINYYFVIGENDYFKSDSTDSIVLHYWSLALEEQFYFIIPILFGIYKLILQKFIKELWNKIWILLSLIFCISLLLINFLPNNMKFFFMFTRIWEFIAGAIIFEFEKSFNDKLSSKIPYYNIICIIIQILCLLILILLSFILPLNSWPNAYTLLVIIISSIFILIKPSISFLPLEMIGNWSYSIYLYHFPLIKIIKNNFNFINYSIYSIIVIISTLILSLISYYFVEKVHKINKWESKQWISYYIFISCFFAINCLYFDLKQELNFNNKGLDLQIINNNGDYFDPYIYDKKFNYSLFQKSIDSCSLVSLYPMKYFWGPGYKFPNELYSDLVIEIKGRKDYCVILLGNSRARHYIPLIKTFVNLTNSTLYDGCTHANFRYSNISKECKNIITFIGDDAQFGNDINYFSNIGDVIFFLFSPRWFFYFIDRDISIMNCINKNYTNISLCNIPKTLEIINNTFPSLYIRKNFHIIDFTDDFCFNNICHINIDNSLVTYDAWHYCPNAILKVFQKFMSFMIGLESGRKFLRNETI